MTVMDAAERGNEGERGEGHAAKLLEIDRMRDAVHRARVEMLERAELDPPAETEAPTSASRTSRLVSVLRDPLRLRAAVGWRVDFLVRKLSDVRSSVRQVGGLRRSSKFALGLLLRDGPRTVIERFARSATTPMSADTRTINGSSDWYSSDEPRVSIIVLNWNRADITLDCVQALWEHTEGHPFEIVIVDNGSREDEYQKLSGIQGPCRILRLDINRFFGEGNNIGVEAALGEFIVLMNNDVTVTSGWLQPLMHALLTDDSCGVAGPKFLYPDGLLQEAGGLLDQEGRSVQRGKFQDPDDPEYNRGLAVDYVSAACCVLRREDFLRVLGFDMMYEPAYYEDADLCLKIGQLGLSTRYVPESVVVHHESVTTSDTSHGLGLTNISELNRVKFLGRWRGYLETGSHEAPADPIPLISCRERRGSRTVGVYSPFNVTPGGGERYLLTLMMELLQGGLNVHFVTPAPYSRARMSALASMFGLDLSGLCLTPLGAAVSLAPFDEWIAMVNQVVPPVQALGIRNTLICQFPFRTGLEQWRMRDRWLPGYQRYLVYSDFAAETLQRRRVEAHLPSVPIEILTPAVEVSAGPTRFAKSGIVSTGRFFVGDHSKRQDLLIDAFRRLSESGVAGDAVLHLAGSSSPEPQHREFLINCMESARDLNVQFHVDAPLSLLNDLYADSSIYWHASGLEVDAAVEPERCEHFGITPIEAMAHGTIPVVVANGGPASTVRDGIDGYHYSTVDELVARSTELLQLTEVELRPMRESARDRSRDFSRDSFNRSVRTLFDL